MKIWILFLVLLVLVFFSMLFLYPFYVRKVCSDDAIERMVRLKANGKSTNALFRSCMLKHGLEAENLFN